MSAMTDEAAAEEVIPRHVADVRSDAINVLPLSIIPLRLKGLRRLSLTKNVRLETVVEMCLPAEA